MGAARATPRPTSVEGVGRKLGQGDAVIASWRYGHTGIDLVVVACFASEDVCRDFETLWLVQGSSRNRDPLAAFLLEE